MESAVAPPSPHAVHTDKDSESKSPKDLKGRRAARPARQIYVPKARRSGDTTEGGPPLSKSSSNSDCGNDKRHLSSPSERSVTTSESPNSVPSRSASSLAGRADAGPISPEYNSRAGTRDSPPSEDTNSLKDDSERSDPGSLGAAECDSADWEMVKGSKPRGLTSDRHADVKPNKKAAVVGSKLRSDYVQPVVSRKSREDVEISAVLDEEETAKKSSVAFVRSNHIEDAIQMGGEWSNFHHKREKKKEELANAKKGVKVDAERHNTFELQADRQESVHHHQHDDRHSSMSGSDQRQRLPGGIGRGKGLDKKIGANVAAVARRGGANPYPQPQPNKLPSQVILEMLKKAGIDMPLEQFQREAAESVRHSDDHHLLEVDRHQKQEVTEPPPAASKKPVPTEGTKCVNIAPSSSTESPGDLAVNVQLSATSPPSNNNSSLFFDPYRQRQSGPTALTTTTVSSANVSFDIDSILSSIPSSYDDFEYKCEKICPSSKPSDDLVGLKVGPVEPLIDSPQKGYDGLKWKSPFDSQLSALKSDSNPMTSSIFGCPVNKIGLTAESTVKRSHFVGPMQIDNLPKAESPGVSHLDPNDLEVQLINENRLKVENILDNSAMMKLFYSQPNPEAEGFGTALVHELKSHIEKIPAGGVLSPTADVSKSAREVVLPAAPKVTKKKEEAKPPVTQWKISESWSLPKGKSVGTVESESKTHSVASGSHSERHSPPILPLVAPSNPEVNAVANWLAQQDLKTLEPQGVHTALKLPPSTVSPEMIGGNDWRSGLAAYTAARFGRGETKTTTSGAVESVMSDESASGRSSSHSASGKDDLIVKAAQKVTWAKWGGGWGASKPPTEIQPVLTKQLTTTESIESTLSEIVNDFSSVTQTEQKPLENIPENTDAISTEFNQVTTTEPILSTTESSSAPLPASSSSLSFQPIFSPLTVAPRTPSVAGTSTASESDIEAARGGRASIVSESCGSSLAGDNWEDLCDEKGEICQQKIIEELNAALGDVRIEKPNFDYYDFRPKDLEVDGDEFSHILEIYDFSATAKTEDIHVALTQLGCVNFGLKWVDDAHALVILTSDMAAQAALRETSVVLKLRPLSEATGPSQAKARLHLDCLQPFKPRPETSALLARRMVEGHLGMKTRISPEQRTHERKKLQAAKERKKELQKAKVDIWEGN